MGALKAHENSYMASARFAIFAGTANLYAGLQDGSAWNNELRKHIPRRKRDG